MQEKDEIDFRNQLLPDKDQTQPKKVGKEEDKPLLTSQMMEDLIIVVEAGGSKTCVKKTTQF